MDPKSSNYSFDEFRKLQQFYEFVVVEKPDAIYMYSNPRGAGYQGFSTATFFQRGPNRTLSSQKSSGCYSASGRAPEPGLDASGKQTCPGEMTMEERFKLPPGSLQKPQPSPTTGGSGNTGGDGLIDGIWRQIPGGFNGIFR
jgi:hypothetical protein